MNKFQLQLLAGLLVSGAWALKTTDVADERAAALLQKNCIRSKIGGVLPAQFDMVTYYLSRPDMFQEFQSAYQRNSTYSGAGDYSIVQTGPGRYHYINEKNQHTDIIELYRGHTSERSFEMVYYATGKRFFGRFEMLVHIRAYPAGLAGTLYTASAHVYPHNGPIRFLARRFGTVERYFRQRTRMMVSVSEKICNGLNDPLPLIYPSPIPASLPAPQTWEGPAPRNDSTPPVYSGSAGPRKHI